MHFFRAGITRNILYKMLQVISIMEVSYCVKQICGEEKEKKIIGIVKSSEYFFQGINNYIEKYFNKYFNESGNYKILENTTVDMINNNNEEGLYLVKNVDNILLVQKNKKISVGYIYNSTYYETKLLFTWKLIPFEDILKETMSATDVDKDSTNEGESKEIDISETEGTTPVTINDELNDSHHETPISTFNFDMVKPNASFLLVDNNNENKMNLLEFIFTNFGIDEEYSKNILIVSSNDDNTHYYFNHFPSTRITDKFDRDTVHEFSINDKGCIVFDNCLTRKSLKLLTKIKDDFIVPIIVIVDNLENIRENYWSNFNYILLTESTNESNRNMVWEKCVNSFSSKQTFDDIFKDCTSNYGAMVVYNLKF